jgi:ACS family tartrate transporter-like MFS transporter
MMNGQKNGPADVPKEDIDLIKKISLRIVPILIFGQIASYLDRSNIAIASLSMMPSLSLDAAHFGFAASLFFIGYFLGELPSNILLVRIGARLWLARIMFTFGIVSMFTAFVTGSYSLYFVRVLLGVAEAGFSPGAVFFLTLWFPKAYRSRIFGLFLLSIPISVILGGPISGGLLKLDGIAGLHGWQWLFVVEGIPALIAGVLCLRFLPTSPADARWLDDGERQRLQVMLARDEAVLSSSGHPVLTALTDLRMWQIAVFSFGVASGSYGALFFLPQIIASFGVGATATSLLNTVPFIAALIAMPLWARRSDRAQEYRLHAAIPLLVASVAFLMAGLTVQPVLKMMMLTLAVTGIFMAMVLLWSFVPVYFAAGVESAAAIAIVNMISTMSGVVQPSVMGYLRVATGSYNPGLYFTSALTLVGVISILLLKPKIVGHRAVDGGACPVPGQCKRPVPHDGERTDRTSSSVSEEIVDGTN